ncbi:MAG: MFS transporter [Candidatus Jordarchaeum sp.]|uniref:MFS transporter n=1 Tax=Candidatus Jordarchaeum sp. TaxID=2823881 RepID=UPI00404B8632
MLGIGIVAPILPIYAEQSLGASGIWIGLIFAGFGLSRSIISPFVGRVSDVRGRKNFLIIGLIGYTLTGLGYVIANSVVLITLIRFANGFTSAMVLPVSQAYIGDITPKGREGTYMSTFMTSLMVGFGAGPFIGGWMADTYGAFSAFYAMAAFSALALALVIIFLPQLEDVRSNPHSELEKQKTVPRIRGKPSLRRAIKDDNVKGIIIYRTSIGLSRNALVSFLPIFLTSSFAASATQVGIILAVFLLVGAVLQSPMGMIADRFDKKKLILIGMSFGASILFTIPYIPNLGIILLVAFLAPIFSVTADAPALALGTEVGRRHGMATVLSLYDTAMGIGMVGGPLISGFFVDNFGINSMFYLWGIVGLTAVLVCYIYLKRGKEYTYILEQSTTEKE